MSNKAKPTIIILAGGKGTRLREVDSSRPKPMVLVKGKPYLYWQLAHYLKMGFRHFILSTGYLGEQIEEYDWKRDFPEATFEFYREATPLGTGGAVKAVFDHFVNLDRAWVVNGDTLIESALPELTTHEKIITVCAIKAEAVFDAKPNFKTDEHFVIGLGDKDANLLDTGAAFLSRATIDACKLPSPFSFHDFLKPFVIKNQVCYALLEGTLFDIGTPERLKRFEKHLS